MHILRLFRRRELPVTRAEPWAISVETSIRYANADMLDADANALTSFEEDQAERDLRGSDAIFGLIGSRSTMDQRGSSRTSERVDADDLISSLHRQYCQALDNPLGSAPGFDRESPSEPSGHYVRDGSGLSADPHFHVAGHNSIEALLSGTQLLDHAFGPLRESELGILPEAEPVPEILRLFAPPEYQITAARSKTALPPTLARREHHSLSIDSPLPMPEATLSGDTP
jgi:hypothetical protein